MVRSVSAAAAAAATAAAEPGGGLNAFPTVLFPFLPFFSLSLSCCPLVSTLGL